MNPAFSVVAFTVIVGAAQGLVVVLGIAVLAGVSVAPGFLSGALLLALVMSVIGLGASFGHLGRKERAWRAAMMWRTSWLSREVIVLPGFIAVAGAWWLSLHVGMNAQWLAVLAIGLSVLLWYCTGMIYACLRFIQEWAQPLTWVNFLLVGLASGLVLASALAAFSGEVDLFRGTGPGALLLLLLAWGGRSFAMRRNARIRHLSTLHSATGIAKAPLVQKSMGMSAGSFNTREFFHGRTEDVVRRIKLAAWAGAFAAPLVLAVLGLATGLAWPWAIAVACQVPGLLADRWLFFAQAKHPQNLYYQVVG